MKDVTIIVGTVGQSIMRSADNGQTWTRIGPRRGFAYEASVRCLALHPRQPNIIFAGKEKGLYRRERRVRDLYATAGRKPAGYRSLLFPDV